MTEQKHTPGPWKFQSGGSDVINIRADGKQIALVKNIDDALLITAAPDLLFFAQEWVKAWNDTTDESGRSDVEIGLMLADLAGQARAAVEKATCGGIDHATAS